jgi:hypothetical protein
MELPQVLRTAVSVPKWSLGTRGNSTRVLIQSKFLSHSVFHQKNGFTHGICVGLVVFSLDCRHDLFVLLNFVSIAVKQKFGSRRRQIFSKFRIVRSIFLDCKKTGKNESRASRRYFLRSFAIS